MRNRTRKRATHDRQADKLRRAFIEDHMNCWICGAYGTQCHEIPRGVHRKAATMFREAWLALCPVCHQQVDDYSVWPIARQAAVKLLKDPGFFDLSILCQLRGRAKTALTLSEVVVYLRLSE